MKTLEEVLTWPWENAVRFTRQDNGVLAEITIFGEAQCFGLGDTLEESMLILQEELVKVIQLYWKNNWPIPDPRNPRGSKIEWIEDFRQDLLDPDDGEEPIACWWDDMRPGEVRQLLKEVYERGYNRGRNGD